MKTRERIRALLLILLVVAAGKLAQQLYRWAAYGEERAQLEALHDRVTDAGVAVVQTQARADTLRRSIEREDRTLKQQQRAIERYERYVEDGALPSHLYAAYRRELNDFNTRVQARNARVAEWNAIIATNHEAVNRYSELADSIRSIGVRIGDPYYPVPLPAEAAAQRGLLPGTVVRRP